MYQPPTPPWRPQEPTQYPPSWPQQPPTQYPPSWQPPQQQTQAYQQPMYYPPYQQQIPPPKKTPVWLWILLGAILMFVCSCIGLYTLGASINAAQSSARATATTSHASSNVVGLPVVVNGTWTVTVNSVSESNGFSDVDQPKSGDMYLVFDVTLKNTSAVNQDTFSSNMFNLRDPSGQAFDQDIGLSGAPNGTVAPGNMIRGQIAYEVPKTAHDFIFQFIPNSFSTDKTEWDIKAS